MSCSVCACRPGDTGPASMIAFRSLYGDGGLLRIPAGARGRRTGGGVGTCLATGCVRSVWAGYSLSVSCCCLRADCVFAVECASPTSCRLILKPLKSTLWGFCFGICTERSSWKVTGLPREAGWHVDHLLDREDLLAVPDAPLGL
uniref:Uncharacterized protein n=1 Tax=Spironucleus salmonicida TaxID=348837 RepID=V6M493_9EUKA|eukprot:EST48149.1 Hypothetical protein SS50377_11710 [Spironucleus salmonicida]